MLFPDTHVFLWWRSEPSKISPELTKAVATTQIDFASAASAWNG